MRLLVAVAALVLSACGSEPPSLEFTDAIADKRLEEKISDYYYHTITPNSKKRVSIQKGDGDVFDVIYDYNVTANYHFHKNLEDVVNYYYKSLSVSGISSGLEAMLDKETTALDAVGIFLKDFNGDISEKDLKQSSTNLSKARLLEEKLSTNEEYASQIMKVIERCGDKCTPFLESDVSSKRHITNTKAYAFLLATNDIIENGMSNPDTKEAVLRVEFQVQAQK